MSFGRMNTFIDIVKAETEKDAEAFASQKDCAITSIRAYKEERRGNEKWANMAAFSTASAMFRFRKIPGLTVDTSLAIVCEGGRYRINSVEDVRGRGMYVEVYAEKLKRTVR